MLSGSGSILNLIKSDYKSLTFSSCISWRGGTLSFSVSNDSSNGGGGVIVFRVKPARGGAEPSPPAERRAALLLVPLDEDRIVGTSAAFAVP